jgi:hypothetical protein
VIDRSSEKGLWTSSFSKSRHLIPVRDRLLAWEQNKKADGSRKKTSTRDGKTPTPTGDKMRGNERDIENSRGKVGDNPPSLDIEIRNSLMLPG